MIFTPINIRSARLAGRIDDNVRLECIESFRNRRAIRDIDARCSSIRVERQKMLAEIPFGSKNENLHVEIVQESVQDVTKATMFFALDREKK